MNMKKIAIICGGDSSEHDVSLKSGAGIYSFFNKDKYDCYIVDLKKGDWHVNLADGKQAPIDKNDSWRMARRSISIMPISPYMALQARTDSCKAISTL